MSKCANAIAVLLQSFHATADDLSLVLATKRDTMDSNSAIPL